MAGVILLSLKNILKFGTFQNLKPLRCLFRRVATNRAGKPGLTSFCETQGSTFLHPISLISENEATEQIKMVPGLTSFSVLTLFFIDLFSLFSEN